MSALARRHVMAAEESRLPKIVDMTNWTASAWRIDRFTVKPGHYDDFILDLTGSGPYDGLSTRVYVTSYDLDGRTDAQLAAWIERKVIEEIATAIRRAA